jgi:hypothetical protein
MTELLSLIIASVRGLHVSSVNVQIMPAGHAAVSLQTDTKEQAADLAQRLEMPQLTLASNDRNVWWYSELGDYGFERITVVGGHRPRCQCHPNGKEV